MLCLVYFCDWPVYNTRRALHQDAAMSLVIGLIYNCKFEPFIFLSWIVFMYPTIFDLVILTVFDQPQALWIDPSTSSHKFIILVCHLSSIQSKNGMRLRLHQVGSIFFVWHDYREIEILISWYRPKEKGDNFFSLHIIEQLHIPKANKFSYFQITSK